jgi:tRNA U38,U39,U40 pseudouridine synthase TruA
MNDSDAGTKASFADLLGSNAFRMFRRTIDSETSRILHQLRVSPCTSVMREMYVESKPFLLH